jgi:predicted MFS family arabinose efflux permease
MASDIPVPSAAAGRGSSGGSDAATFVLLATGGFFSLVSTRICDAMVPALALAFAGTTQQAAAAISAYAVAYGAMQLVYGPLGDRFGKPRVIGWASAVCALGTVSAALAPSLASLVFARAAMGAGAAAIVPLSLAWIGDTTPLDLRQQTLARYSSVTVIGMVIGPLLGGLLSQALSWRAAFVLLAPLFVGLALLLLLRPAPGAGMPARPAIEPPSSYLQTMRQLLGSPWARVIMVAAVLEAGFGIAAMAFVPTVLHDRLGLPLLQGGAICALFGVGGFLFGRSAALLLRWLRPPRMPGVAGGLLAIAFVLLAWMPGRLPAALGCTLAGFGFFMMHNTLQVQATQLSLDASGLAVSLFSCSVFVGQSLGVLAGAVSFTRVSPAWSFIAAALALLALGQVLMLLLRRRDSPNPGQGGLP